MARKYGRLKQLIKETFGTQKGFADAMEMNVSTVNLKLNDKSEWTIGELEKICTLFSIEMNEIKD